MSEHCPLIDDGGPAFPRDFGEGHGGENGMSLRDWFAGQAVTNVQGGPAEPSEVAAFAYQIADAMLAERKRREGGAS